MNHFILIFHPTAGTPEFNLGCSKRNMFNVYKCINVYICNAINKVRIANNPGPSVK